MKKQHGCHKGLIAWLGAGLCLLGTTYFQAQAQLPQKFQWRASPPLLQGQRLAKDEVYAFKDPSVVFSEGRWHLFCTVRGRPRSHAIAYFNFADWNKASQASPVVLPNHEGFFCAPQVFYFRPHQRWYLICQAADKTWTPNYRPAFATTTRLDDPASWSRLTPLDVNKPLQAKAWLDFWIIADDQHAYLFFTSLDGKMWRARTPLDKFPQGWSEPVLALEGDIFEASHTYKLRGTNQYLTLVEAQNGHGWRYYKAYVADKLDGLWKPLAATRDHAFASLRNVIQPIHWTDSISHGELLRAGVDERLEVDPKHLRFVFQGVLDRDRQGLPYGQIPWKLGLLELINTPP